MGLRPFLEAAHRILGGDDSRQAANALESALLDQYPDDERFDELADVLASYAPGMGREYSGPEELRAAVSRALGLIK